MPDTFDRVEARIKAQLTTDLPVVGLVTGASFALDAKGGVYEFLLGLITFFLLGMIFQLYVWRVIRDPERVSVLLHAPAVSSDAEVLRRVTARVPLWVAGSAILVAVAGTSFAGIALGAVLSLPLSLAILRHEEARQQLTILQRVDSKQRKGPWFYATSWS